MLANYKTMKKNFLFACLFLGAAQICFGQFTSGQKVLGGTISLGYSQSKDTAANSYQGNNYSFVINPSFGKFKDEKTLAEFGLSIGFGHNKLSSLTDTSINKTFSAGVGYTVTKLYPIVNKVYFTLNLPNEGLMPKE